jgi:hypothetical protein
VEQLIGEASCSPRGEDKLRLKGLLELRAALLAGRRAKADNPRASDE